MRIEPRATYRIQLTSEFDFDAAPRSCPYLAELGHQSFVQLAVHAGRARQHPRLRRGRLLMSAAISAEPPATNACAQRCATAGMGQILDIVPNHMAITGRENPWWWDVLENGLASRYSAYFDVDWEPPEARLRNSVLLPVLGDHYGRALEAGEIKLVRDGADFTFHYYERTFPVAPRSLDTLLARAAERCGSDELAFIADSLTALPFSTDTDAGNLRRRQRDIAVLKGAIGASPSILAGGGSGHRRSHRRVATPTTTCCMRCSSARITAWRFGARPAATSATGASSISTI